MTVRVETTRGEQRGSRPARHRFFCFLSLAMTLCLAPWAQAHDASFPIGGDSIAIDTQGDPSTWTFNFATTGQAAFSLLHSPLLSPTRLLVRGLGPTPGALR